MLQWKHHKGNIMGKDVAGRMFAGGILVRGDFVGEDVVEGDVSG